MINLSLEETVRVITNYGSATNIIVTLDRVKSKSYLLDSDKKILRETGALLEAIDSKRARYTSPQLCVEATRCGPLYYEALMSLKAPESVTFSAIAKTLENAASGRKYDAEMLNHAEKLLTYVKKEYRNVMNRGNAPPTLLVS